MQSSYDQFKDRVRRRLAKIVAAAKQMSASLTPTTRAVQRMCPFCGLITPRSKANCMECGKSLAPARP